MKEYPVGSVCEIINGYEEFVGKECTIVGGLATRMGRCKEGKATVGVKYSVTVQGYEDRVFNAVHEQLRLKRLPPDAKFESFMDKLKKPLSDGEMETLRKEMEELEEVV